jgi:predicted transposase/invertase (TIGR01784 family)
MEAAVHFCLESGILKGFMEKHSREVLSMRITEWNTEEAKVVWREEGVEEGLERGRAEGRAEGQEKLQEKLQETARKLKAMGLTMEQIAAATGLPVDELE